MVNESHTSEAASSEAAANSTFIEDLEKSIDALEAAEMASMLCVAVCVSCAALCCAVRVCQHRLCWV